MEQGELEHRKAFEETATKNIRTIGAYTTDTRNLVRDQDKKIKDLEGLMLTQTKRIDNLQIQIANLQAIVYKNGT